MIAGNDAVIFGGLFRNDNPVRRRRELTHDRVSSSTQKKAVREGCRLAQAEDVDAEQVLQLTADVSDGLVERTDSNDTRHGS